MSARLVIGKNAVASNTFCSFCQQPLHVPEGPCLQEVDFWGYICPICGQRHSPELSAVLASWEKNKPIIERRMTPEPRQDQVEISEADLRHARDLFHLAH